MSNSAALRRQIAISLSRIFYCPQAVTLVSYPQTTEYFLHIPPSDGIDCPRAVSQFLQLCTVNSLSTLELYCPQAVKRGTPLLHNEDIAFRQYNTSLFLYQCMQHLTLLFFFSYRSFFCNLQFCCFSSFLSFFFYSVLYFSSFFFFQILLLVPRIIPIALLPLLNSNETLYIDDFTSLIIKMAHTYNML